MALQNRRRPSINEFLIIFERWRRDDENEDDGREWGHNGRLIVEEDKEGEALSFDAKMIVLCFTYSSSSSSSPALLSIIIID